MLAALVALENARLWMAAAVGSNRARSARIGLWPDRRHARLTYMVKILPDSFAEDGQLLTYWIHGWPRFCTEKRNLSVVAFIAGAVCRNSVPLHKRTQEVRNAMCLDYDVAVDGVSAGARLSVQYRVRWGRRTLSELSWFFGRGEPKWW